jgi:hypothetical protein
MMGKGKKCSLITVFPLPRFNGLAVRLLPLVILPAQNLEIWPFCHSLGTYATKPFFFQ